MFISRKHSRGLTLLEVTLALSLLALICGSIYAVLKGSIDSAAALHEDRNRRQQVEGVIELCRNTFHMLPAYANLEMRIRVQGSLALPEVIIRNAPELLAWDQVNDLQAISALGIKPEVGGRFSLALLRTRTGNNALEDPVARARPEEWVTLLSDVISVKWRFRTNQGPNEWVDILPAGSPRPRAAELTLELAGEEEPIRMVFDIVPLANNPRLGRRNQGPAGGRSPGPGSNPQSANPGAPNPGTPNPAPGPFGGPSINRRPAGAQP